MVTFLNNTTGLTKLPQNPENLPTKYQETHKIAQILLDKQNGETYKRSKNGKFASHAPLVIWPAYKGTISAEGYEHD